MNLPEPVVGFADVRPSASAIESRLAAQESEAMQTEANSHSTGEMSLTRRRDKNASEARARHGPEKIACAATTARRASRANSGFPPLRNVFRTVSAVLRAFRTGVPLLRTVAGSAQDVAETLRNVAGGAQNLAETFRDVAGGAQDVAETFRNVAGGAQDLARTFRVVAQASQDVAETSSTLPQAANAPSPWRSWRAWRLACFSLWPL